MLSEEKPPPATCNSIPRFARRSYLTSTGAPHPTAFGKPYSIVRLHTSHAQEGIVLPQSLSAGLWPSAASRKPILAYATHTTLGTQLPDKFSWMLLFCSTTARQDTYLLGKGVDDIFVTCSCEFASETCLGALCAGCVSLCTTSVSKHRPGRLGDGSLAVAKGQYGISTRTMDRSDTMMIQEFAG